MASIADTSMGQVESGPDAVLDGCGWARHDRLLPGWGLWGAIMKTLRVGAVALEPRFAPMVERLDAVLAARKDARLAYSVIKESVRLRLRDLPTSRIQG